MMAGQEWDPNIFLKMVIMAGGPAHTPTIELATYKKIKNELKQLLLVTQERDYGITGYK